MIGPSNINVTKHGGSGWSLSSLVGWSVGQQSGQALLYRMIPWLVSFQRVVISAWAYFVCWVCPGTHCLNAVSILVCIQDVGYCVGTSVSYFV